MTTEVPNKTDLSCRLQQIMSFVYGVYFVIISISADCHNYILQQQTSRIHVPPEILTNYNSLIFADRVMYRRENIIGRSCYLPEDCHGFSRRILKYELSKTVGLPNPLLPRVWAPDKATSSCVLQGQKDQKQNITLWYVMQSISNYMTKITSFSYIKTFGPHINFSSTNENESMHR